jgi:pyruvate dehydrogenase E2 component (dihydrolipoamide acetyltransferase)
MAIEIVMPQMSTTMETGVVGRWWKGEGEAVEVGDIVVEVETDKATVEIEAEATGVLQGIMATEGQTVPVGYVMAWIATPGEQRQLGNWETGLRGAGNRAKFPNFLISQLPPTPHSLLPTPSGPPRRIATPAARKLARKQGVDLAAVTGRGPHGRIVLADVEAAFSPTAAPVGAGLVPAPPPITGGRRVEWSPMRRAIARTVTESAAIPQFQVRLTVDMTAVEARREAIERAHGERISYTPFILQAVAPALKQVPELNATCDGEGLFLYDTVHLGLAVATEEGMLVPVLRDADRLGVRELHAAATALIEKARQRRLTRAETTGGTFTVSNLGMFGVDDFVALLHPPQTGILAVGAVQRQLVVDGDALRIKPLVRLTLSADHRAVDGAAAARFLKAIQERLERVE